MQELSLSKKILNKMEENDHGTIYTTTDFYDLGNPDAIRKALSRLTEEKKIERLIDGYYTIPKYSELLQEYSYPTAEKLAQKIAEKYAWNITPYEDNALNQVGLSTQVPTNCEYLSDGPYREYLYRGRMIKFKHTSNRNISKYSLPLSLVIQSIKAKGKDNITQNDIQKMSVFSKKYVKENLTNNTKSLPAWIYKILKEIQETN